MAVSVFAWSFRVEPMIAASESGLLATVLDVAYPLGDLLVLFCLLMVLAARDGRASVGAVFTLSVGVCSLVAADVAFLYRQLQQSYVLETVLDLLWPLGCMLVGIAANEVRCAGAARSGGDDVGVASPPAGVPLWRTLLPELLVLPVVVLAAHAQYGEVPASQRGVTGIGAVLMLTLVIVRKGLSAGDSARPYDSLRVAFAELATGHESLGRANEELRRNEERFQLAVRATRDAIYDWDVAGGTVWWSSSFLNTYGWDESSVATTVEWWVRQIHPEDAPIVSASLSRALEDGQHFWSAEYRLRRGNGTYAHALDRGYVLRDEQGKPVRMIGAVMDFTERKRAEGEMRRAKLAAEDASRTKSEFLANISHEIRTPMTAAHAMEGDRGRCLAAGCDGFLPQPIDRRLLLETVRARAVDPGAGREAA